jgi:hypothetical protein
MLVNKEKKVVFNTPYKTGSHTLQATILRSNFVLSQHAKYSDIKKKEPKLYEDIKKNYKKYIVVRNPWTHATSHYMHNLEKRQNKRLFENNCPEQYKTNFISFKNFLKSKFYIPQSVVSFNDPNFMYDKVLKFENLDIELKNLCQELNITYKPWKKNLGTETKKEYFNNIKYPLDYRKLYDKESIEIVKTRSSKEIELFNYKF